MTHIRGSVWPDSDDGVWRLATALSGAVTPLDVARALADEGAGAAGAVFSNLAMLDTETKRVRAVHPSSYDPAIAARWTEFNLETPTPLCEAILTGRPVLLESLEVIGSRYPELLADTAGSGLGATASMPLATASGVIGAAGFAWRDAQDFRVDQVRRLELIAHMASLALERAVLHQHERERASSRERADAELIQNAFLPRELSKSESLEVAAVYLPANDAAMGGDWYDVFPIDSGTCLVIGDVAGHGLHSAAVMAQLRNTIRSYAIEDPSPASVLTRLNRMICRLEPGQSASAIVAVWDERNGSILRSNAGHPPVLRCRIGEFGYLIPRPGGLLLGVDPHWIYQEEIKELRPGTTLLFYTDGLVERRGQGLDRGMEVLLNFVRELDDLSPQGLCDQIIDQLLAPQRQDDVCLLAARVA